MSRNECVHPRLRKSDSSELNEQLLSSGKVYSCLCNKGTCSKCWRRTKKTGFGNILSSNGLALSLHKLVIVYCWSRSYSAIQAVRAVINLRIVRQIQVCKCNTKKMGEKSFQVSLLGTKWKLDLVRNFRKATYIGSYDSLDNSGSANKGGSEKWWNSTNYETLSTVASINIRTVFRAELLLRNCTKRPRFFETSQGLVY